jgi:hypothetical protein
MKAGRDAELAAMLPLSVLRTEAADCLARMLWAAVVRVHCIGDCLSYEVLCVSQYVLWLGFG